MFSWFDSFFVVVNAESFIWTYQDFVYSSIEGHLDCFHVLTLKNNASIDIHVQVLCGDKL